MLYLTSSVEDELWNENRNAVFICYRINNMFTVSGKKRGQLREVGYATFVSMCCCHVVALGLVFDILEYFMFSYILFHLST